MTAAAFRSGVIEGFYGRPWSEEQRLRILADLASWGLTTYLYAPKDDLAHRVLWRRPYAPAEAAALQRLADGASRAGVHFAYGLAPGLDLRYADEQDAAALHAKVAQVLGLGARTVALLFDDVPRQLRPEDAERYGRLAAAQAETANRVHAQVLAGGGDALLFCPTDYCAAMARPSVAESAYLRELGERLDPAIEVFWTGPDVVSETIEADDARQAAAALRRKPLLWDNLHANDYDRRRLHLGPYSGRPGALRGEVSGILLNPDNEASACPVPLMTLAAYLREDAYEPRAAFLQAVAAWAARLELVDGAASGPPAPVDGAAGGSKGAAGRAGGPAMDAEDLAYLADFLYLPFEHGPAAQAFLEDVAYLLVTPPAAWEDTFARVAGAAMRLAGLARTLTRLRDREALADLQPHLLAVLTEVGRAARAAAGRRAGPRTEAPPDGIDNVERGGFSGALERLLQATVPRAPHGG
ncbi:MAG TPA: beta-N-acetylglucosaminidase domain-containing protein [Trueperaceae bacterium]|nr:beta-N-acetylglucosaminidase domain-containing protein [Trueperaceae bacterium]